MRDAALTLSSVRALWVTDLIVICLRVHTLPSNLPGCPNVLCLDVALGDASRGLGLEVYWSGRDNSILLIRRLVARSELVQHGTWRCLVEPI